MIQVDQDLQQMLASAINPPPSLCRYHIYYLKKDKQHPPPFCWRKFNNR